MDEQKKIKEPTIYEMNKNNSQEKIHNLKYAKGLKISACREK